MLVEVVDHPVPGQREPQATGEIGGQHAVGPADEERGVQVVVAPVAVDRHEGVDVGEEAGEERGAGRVGLVRRHVVLQVVGLHDRVAGRPRAARRLAGDLGGAGLEPAVEGEEPDRRRQHLLLDHVGVREQVGEGHPPTVAG